MIKEVNNKIVEDVLASFEMDYINVPNLIVEKVKEELKDKETEITFEKLIELYQYPIDMDFGVEHLRAIHYYLFSDIYYFAGCNRIVYMEKNNSYFSPVEEIDYRLD